MVIDDKVIKNLSKLSNIAVVPKDYDRYKISITRILTWIDNLNNIDTTGVQPKDSVHLQQTLQRADKITDGGYVQEIMTNAPTSCSNMFSVPKVIE